MPRPRGPEIIVALNAVKNDQKIIAEKWNLLTLILQLFGPHINQFDILEWVATRRLIRNTVNCGKEWIVINS